MQVHTIYSFSDFCKCYFWKISHEVLSSSQHFMSVFLQVFISSLLLLTTEWKRKKVKVVQLCPTLRAHGLYSPWNSPGQNTEVRSLSLLQGIFPNQGLNPCLPHCRGILYQLSHKKAQDTGVGSLSLFQRIFPTQESHPGLLHCRWILYKLSHQGSFCQFFNAQFFSTSCHHITVRHNHSWLWMHRVFFFFCLCGIIPLSITATYLVPHWVVYHRG